MMSLENQLSFQLWMDSMVRRACIAEYMYSVQLLMLIFVFLSNTLYSRSFPLHPGARSINELQLACEADAGQSTDGARVRGA